MSDIVDRQSHPTDNASLEFADQRYKSKIITISMIFLDVWRDVRYSYQISDTHCRGSNF